MLSSDDEANDDAVRGWMDGRKAVEEDSSRAAAMNRFDEAVMVEADK